MTEQKKVIMFDSPEAAKKTTMEVWVSSNGFGFFKEEQARYDGCTHQPCNQCGQPAEKMYTICEACRAKKRKDDFLKLPEEEWDGKVMVYSHTTDDYYPSPEEALDFVEDATFDELRLVLCEPNHLRPLDSSYWEDALSTEDESIPGLLEDAIEALNKAIENSPPVSWSPRAVRVKRPAGLKDNEVSEPEE